MELVSHKNFDAIYLFFNVVYPTSLVNQSECYFFLQKREIIKAYTSNERLDTTHTIACILVLYSQVI